MTRAAKSPKAVPCPCGAGVYADCCGRFISQGEVPQSAQQLMRSRYSAYVLRDEAYLQATWSARSRPPSPLLQADDGVKWIALEVLRQQQEGDTATVEFVARYKVDGRAHRLHEVSRFEREDGRWFYLDGSFPQA